MKLLGGRESGHPRQASGKTTFFPRSAGSVAFEMGNISKAKCSKEHLEQVLEEFVRQHPGKNRLDEEIPPDKAAVLEEEFRREDSGILAWYARQLQRSKELRGNRVQSIREERQAKRDRKRR